MKKPRDKEVRDEPGPENYLTKRYILWSLTIMQQL